MSGLSFTRGDFKTLVARTTIHLGRLEKNIQAGDEVEYDGFNLKFLGEQISMPELKSGIKRGWLTVKEAGMIIPPAPVPEPVAKPRREMAIQKVYDEERAVAEVTPSAGAEETPKKFPLKVESGDVDTIEVSKFRAEGAEVGSASSAGDGVAEAQGAQAVSSIKLKTAANQKTVLSDGNQISSEISKLESMTRDAAPAPLLDEIFEEETPAADEEKAVEDLQLLQAIEGEVEPDQGAVVIGEDKSKVVTLEGGVEWDKGKHWRKRAKLAVELYVSDLDTLNKIKAIETKGVIEAIDKAIAGEA